jgi:hypothetical protein
MWRDWQAAKALAPGRGFDLVYLVSGVAGALTGTDDRLFAQCLRQAEDDTGLRVGPGLLEVGVLPGLDVEIL